MNRSGLPDGHFVMLIPGVGTDLWVSSARMRESDPIESFSEAIDPHRLSSGWFPCVRLLSFRPISMDARHEAQDDNPHRSG